MDEKLDFTLSGRLRNIVLAPSAQNSLTPLFEAITNSIHAIEDRFGLERVSDGFIHIRIERSGQKVESYGIDDNGEGLTPENYKSFITSDSVKKIIRGGKGVGRLLWLKVFNEVQVSSYYELNKEINKLSFLFKNNDISPISKKEIKLADTNSSIGTSIRMTNMFSSFQNRAPIKSDTIKNEIIRHFISYLISDKSPQFIYFDDDGKANLSEYFRDHIFESQTQDITITLDGNSSINLNIQHLLVSKSLRDIEIGYNTIYLNADGRNAERYDIDTQLGLKHIRSEYVYMGIVSSEHFNNYVNQERTHLSIDQKDKELIKRQIFESVKQFLHEDIEEIRKDQREKAEKTIRLNPRFISISEDLDSFLDSKIPLSMRNEEEIHLAFEREYRRVRNRISKEFLGAIASKNAANVKEKTKNYIGFVNEDIKNNLAEYVIRRKAVLDLVQTSQGYEDPEKKKHYLEEIIHDYICPLRANSDDLTYEDHNLWLIDDRLAFYNYFASDRPIKTFQPENKDRKEPDIALFNVGLGLRRTGSDQPVVIVEFKRPGREDYANDRPVEQIIKYVISLRENGSIKDKSGRVISFINKNTSFIGYIVADLTEGLKRSLIGTIVNRPTADGVGKWGFEDEMRTYIEVIPYEKLFRDAQARNEIFFDKLKLQS